MSIIFIICRVSRIVICGKHTIFYVSLSPTRSPFTDYMIYIYTSLLYKYPFERVQQQILLLYGSQNTFNPIADGFDAGLYDKKFTYYYIILL